MVDDGPIAAAPGPEWFQRVADRCGLVSFVLRIKPDLAFEFINGGDRTRMAKVRPDRSTAAVRALLGRIEPDSAAALEGILAMRPGQSEWIDLAWRHVSGGPVHSHGWVHCTERPDGSVVVEGVMEDVTELRAVEGDLHNSEERYRLLADNAWEVVWTMALDGSITYVSPAVERVRGFTPEEAMRQSPEEIHPRESAAKVGNYFSELFAAIENRTEIPVYRAELEYYRKDGSIMTGELQVIPHIDADGTVVEILGVTRDISERTAFEAELVASEQRNRALAQGLQSQLSSAAKYVEAVLPDDLAGQVSVSSRYLPSNTLGGDFFDFLWIDDDHLVVYLLDVSGHGVESALIAVSVRNLLRSASLTTETMLEPDQILATLNHQFAMERHDDNYFTIFYGVYQRSTGTLRYANAGHPPALLLAGEKLTELPNPSLPVGVFNDTEFVTTAVAVPPGSQILLYSDGAYEIPLDGGGQWSYEDFLGVFTRMAGSPDWSLDDLVATLRQRSATGDFDDDCCLLRLTFD